MSLNAVNYLNSPRIIASRVNETNNSSITVLPGDRSFNMTLNLGSSDSRVSPIIDTERISAILTSNRVDKLISDFTTDNRVDTIEDDPSGAQYISKENIRNISNIIKIILDAHINEYNDIRAFYAIAENPELNQYLFHGFTQLKKRTRLFLEEKSDRKIHLFTITSERIPSRQFTI